MPPQNQYPQYPQTSQHNNGQYDFIMAPQQPNRPGLFGNTKMLLFVVGVVAVLIVLVIFFVSLFSGGKESSVALIKAAQQQQEIARVADTGLNDASSQATKNFAMTSKLTMTSEQKRLTSYLADHGVKVSTKELAGGLDSTHDTALQNAKATSALDATLTKLLTEEVTQYQTTLRQAYSATKNTDTRSLLNQLYQDADLLLQQSKQ